MPMLPNRRLLPIALALAAAVGPAQTAAIDEPPFRRPERLGYLPAKALPEASGVQKSPRHPGIFWTHNDSGDAAELFAVRGDGTVVRRLAVPGAANVDWEDLAFDAAGRIVIADIGDNRAERREITFYRLDEPDPAGTGPIPAATVFRCRYPAKFGPVDAEALFVRGEHAFIVTKEKKTARVVRFALGPTADGAPQVGEVLGALPGFALVTAASLSSDGRHLAVLNYLRVVVLDFAQPLAPAAPGPELLATLGSAPRREAVVLLGQSEGIAWDGGDLVVVTEQGPGNGRPALWRIAAK